jgi:hypothetical protein
MQRALIQYRDPQNYALVKEALVREGRQDLIGFGEQFLIPPRQVGKAGQRDGGRTGGKAGHRDGGHTGGKAGHRDGGRETGKAGNPGAKKAARPAEKPTKAGRNTAAKLPAGKAAKSGKGTKRDGAGTGRRSK